MSVFFRWSGLVSLMLCAWTAGASGWQCFTEPLSTSFVADDVGENLNLTVFHHNGVQYMPIHSGIITPSDLGYLKSQGEVLTKLGSDFTVSFNKKNCKSYGEWKNSCFTNEKFEVGGLTVDSAHLTTSTSTHEIFDYVFEEIEIHLSLRIEGKSHSIPMKYAKSQCKK